MFHAGQQIGSYMLINRLGRGGFGEVWLAERKSKFVTTKVAVKLPLHEQVDHEAVKQEAQLWQQASGHPNILPIIDADEYDGQIVIVSEYAPDGSLDEWLKTNGAMPVERAIETTIQILDGLEFLHSRNIIHRDLKPANILLQGSTPRLADFGISRALRTTVASQSQNISGTFGYMSPEALDGKRSVQTDVWSVGVNLYQFLTGTLPFPHKEPSVLFPAIIVREFAPLPDSIPQSLKSVVAKALSKSLEIRYKTASEMREDLRLILRGENIANLFQQTSQHNNFIPKYLPNDFKERNYYDEEETKIRTPENEILTPDSEQDIYVLVSEPKYHKPNINQVAYDFYKHLKELTFQITGKYAINPERNLEKLRIHLNQSISNPRKTFMGYRMRGQTATLHNNQGEFSFNFGRKANLTKEGLLTQVNECLYGK